METVNFNKLAKHFNDENSARELLEKLRWPKGAFCPHCEATSPYKLTPKADSKKPVREGVYKCRECRKQFTVTVGTIFESGRIPLHKWLMVVYLMCSSKKGISSHQIHRMIGVTYKTAWFMTQRIREAMKSSPLVEMLGGMVEVDETYIGGKEKNKHASKRTENTQGRSIKTKTPVVALVQRDGQLRAFKMEAVTGKTLKEVIRKNVSPKAHIKTDAFPAYNGLDQEFASHEVVDHASGEYVRGDAHTNTAEGWFSLLKRGITGTFHHVSEQHLPRYVAEFEFRFNRRERNDGERTVAAILNAKGKRLYYRQPKRKPAHGQELITNESNETPNQA